LLFNYCVSDNYHNCPQIVFYYYFLEKQGDSVYSERDINLKFIGKSSHGSGCRHKSS
jgi:hypothetical protein